MENVTGMMKIMMNTLFYTYNGWWTGTPDDSRCSSKFQTPGDHIERLVCIVANEEVYTDGNWWSEIKKLIETYSPKVLILISRNEPFWRNATDYYESVGETISELRDKARRIELAHDDLIKFLREKKLAYQIQGGD